MVEGLEEIFRKDGKWINNEDKEVIPKIIGYPSLIVYNIHFLNDEEEKAKRQNLEAVESCLNERMDNREKYKDVNAFSISINPRSLHSYIQFYKIQ